MCLYKSTKCSLLFKNTNQSHRKKEIGNIKEGKYSQREGDRGREDKYNIDR